MAIHIGTTDIGMLVVWPCTVDMLVVWPCAVDMLVVWPCAVDMLVMWPCTVDMLVVWPFTIGMLVVWPFTEIVQYVPGLLQVWTCVYSSLHKHLWKVVTCWTHGGLINSVHTTLLNIQVSTRTTLTGKIPLYSMQMLLLSQLFILFVWLRINLLKITPQGPRYSHNYGTSSSFSCGISDGFHVSFYCGRSYKLPNW